MADEKVTAATATRCHFLRLPVELRLKIYGYLAFQYETSYTTCVPKNILTRICFGKDKAYDSALLANYRQQVNEYLTITRVSREIREETVPAMYRDLKYIIFNNGYIKYDIRDWLQEVDPLALASVRKFEICFKDCPMGTGYFAVWPRQVDNPISVWYCRVAPGVLSACVCHKSDYLISTREEKLKEVMEGLPLAENGNRRAIDKAALTAMLKIAGFVVDPKPAAAGDGQIGEQTS